MYCSPLPLPLPFHRLAPVSVPPLLSLSTIMLYYCGTGCAQQLVIQLVIIVPLCSGPLVIIVTLPHCCCCHCHHCCYCRCCCHCSGPHPLILSFCAAVALARQSARHCGAMAVAARLIVSIVPVLPHQHHHFHVLSLSPPCASPGHLLPLALELSFPHWCGPSSSSHACENGQNGSVHAGVDTDDQDVCRRVPMIVNETKVSTYLCTE